MMVMEMVTLILLNTDGDTDTYDGDTNAGDGGGDIDTGDGW